MQYFKHKESYQEIMLETLKTFWCLARKSNADERLELLKEYSEKTFGKPRDSQRIKKARGHFGVMKKNSKKVWNKINSPCLVCGGDAECRHHIIQIQNGGHNGKKNLAPLCNLCHGKIHPWM